MRAAATANAATIDRKILIQPPQAPLAFCRSALLRPRVKLTRFRFIPLAVGSDRLLRPACPSDIFIPTAEHPMAEWFVAKISEFADGERRIVTAGKREIGVFHKGGAYYAYSNVCLHQGGPAC